MPIDPSISLQVTPPNFGTPAIQSIGQLMNIRDVASQVQQRQALTQQAVQHSKALEQEAEQKRLDLTDQNTFMQGMRDPTVNARVHSNDFSDFEGKVQARNLDPIKKMYLDYSKGLLANTAETNKQRVEALAEVSSTLNGLKDKIGTDGKIAPRDISEINAALPDVAQRLNRAGTLKAAGIENVPTSFVDRNQIDSLVASLNGGIAAHTQVLGLQKTQSEIQAQQAQAKLHTTEEAEKAKELAGYNEQGQSPTLQVQQAHNEAQQKMAEAELARGIRADAEKQRHNISDESIGRTTAAVAAGRLAQEQMVNGMKYGPGTTEYWVKQIQENPDSIKEMPAELRSTVGKGFTQATGLPLPTPANASSQAQEAAARNALDNATFIQKALQNPEIKANLGPIMGRLGNAEEALGTSAHLSPEASKLAQELRTRMRYFVFQEGKAVLGGRLPQQLMQQLESSSANPKMDPAMLQGALNGATGSANSVLENVDKQRFGGQARSSTMRHAPDITPSKTIRARDEKGNLHEAPEGSPLPTGWKLEK